MTKCCEAPEYVEHSNGKTLFCKHCGNVKGLEPEVHNHFHYHYQNYPYFTTPWIWPYQPGDIAPGTATPYPAAPYTITYDNTTVPLTSPNIMGVLGMISGSTPTVTSTIMTYNGSNPSIYATDASLYSSASYLTA